MDILSPEVSLHLSGSLEVRNAAVDREPAAGQTGLPNIGPNTRGRRHGARGRRITAHMCHSFRTALPTGLQTSTRNYLVATLPGYEMNSHHSSQYAHATTITHSATTTATAITTTTTMHDRHTTITAVRHHEYNYLIACA